MSVEIQSDLIVWKFWQDVRVHLIREMTERNLGEWTVVIRPQTQADGFFSKDPDKFNLSRRKAKELDRAPDMETDKEKRTATFSVPDTENFHVRYLDGSASDLSASDLADEFATDLEMTAGDEDE